MVTLEAVLMNDFHGGYIATCPTMPDCYARGVTQTEALAALKETVVATLRDTLAVTADDVTFHARQQFPCASDWPMAA